MVRFPEELNKRYKIERNLGNLEGRFVAFDHQRKIHVLLKIIEITSYDNGIPSEILREISTLKELDHENIARLLDVVITAENIAMVFEYLNCTLTEVLWTHTKPPFDDEDRLKSLTPKDAEIVRTMTKMPNQQMPMPENRVKVFLYQMLKGLAYSHSTQFKHRNIAPWNILVDETTNLLKLCDFVLPGEYIQNNQYKAPEILLETDHDSSADIWALGCLYVDMIKGGNLFKRMNPKPLLTQMFSWLGVPSENEWPGIGVLCRRISVNIELIGSEPDYHELIGSEPDYHETCRDLNPVGVDLLSKMLCVVPSRRITAHDALKHPYFDDIDLNLIGRCSNQANCLPCCIITPRYFA